MVQKKLGTGSGVTPNPVYEPFVLRFWQQGKCSFSIAFLNHRLGNIASNTSVQLLPGYHSIGRRMGRVVLRLVPLLASPVLSTSPASVRCHRHGTPGSHTYCSEDLD